jgi:uncharacterized protein YyaL (SSP411 family)
MSPNSNRLANETSPYLLQHAHNPVDWYPWGAEALSRAAEEDRPIFLSVGYAACHWCHVMERESFEDEKTAAMLNASFVSIKVDREERPDLDAVYMAAVQAMNGAGGWPMSLFLTPDGRPFFGGSYFPSEPRYGMASFRQILTAVAEAWRDRRQGVEESASGLAEELARRQPAMPGPASSDAAGDLEAAVARLVGDFDFEHGGWAGPPRFPQPTVIDLLLRRASDGSNDRALQVAERPGRVALRALDVMADGGIRDHVGGGFHRYSTDTDWLVPHFEKMLYDNAQLARVYLHAYQLTGEPRFRDVAESTLDYMAREMVTPDGLFAASQDADTDSVEGATYVWTSDEIEAVLAAEMAPWTADPPGAEDAPGAEDPPPAGLAALFASAYGVARGGNWEGRTILSRVMTDAALAAMYGLTEVDVRPQLARARRLLFERRRLRPQPALDDKAIAAWNGLALAAFAEAIPVLNRASDREVARRAAEAALRLLRGPDGRVSRSFRAGRTTGLGVLEDYADLTDGLVALYEATFEERWLIAARELAATVESHFADPAGGWFDTADDAESLVVRPKEVQDGAAPSGGAATAAVMLRLAELTGKGELRTAAERAIRQVAPLGARYPLAFGAWLAAQDFAESSVSQIAIVGDPDGGDTRALLAVARRGFQPHRVMAAGEPQSSAVELLKGRFALDGRATAFVCRDFACRQPVAEPEALAAALI